MTKQEILQTMVYELIARGVVKDQKGVAALIKGNEATISAALSNKEGKLTDRLLNRINHASGMIFNQQWVATGNGPIFAPNADTQTFIVGMGDNSQVGGSGNTYNAGANATELAALRKENVSLKAENATLRKEIAEKDKAIARLEGKIEIYKEMTNNNH